MSSPKYQRVGLENNSISIYIAKYFFNKGDIVFKHISDISIYITSVSHTLIYLRWPLNKYEHCTFQNQSECFI